VTEHPEDTCECGDYRRDHPNNGPCRMNQRDFDLCHGGRDCMSFRMAATPSTEGRKGEDQADG
jgi:hypothetical protein